MDEMYLLKWDEHMKRFYFILLAVFSLLGFSSCDDDDHFSPDSVVEKAFLEKYPTATHVSWVKKGNYVEAEFKEGTVFMKAWFDLDGNWSMTETEITDLRLLPVAVQEAFAASAYAQWKIDDIDQLERPGMETVYIIEVENGNQEVDLIYSAEGVLIKEVVDQDDDHESYLPQTLPTAVTTFINTHYPGARILESGVEKGKLEVDILHEGKSKEVVFDANNQWLYTEYDVLLKDVPQVVIDSWKSSVYKDYRLDDLDVFETSDGKYYQFELESGEREVKFLVNEDGTIRN